MHVTKPRLKFRNCTMNHHLENEDNPIFLKINICPDFGIKISL